MWSDSFLEDSDPSTARHREQILATLKSVLNTNDPATQYYTNLVTFAEDDVSAFHMISNYPSCKILRGASPRLIRTIVFTF